jgi:uncharacterized membrane protein YidH (DUF202 family)
MKLGRPKRTPLALKISALGFFLMSIGLFSVPHDLGFSGVFHAAFTSGAEQHSRALLGIILIATGLLLGILGSIMVATQQQEIENEE